MLFTETYLISNLTKASLDKRLWNVQKNYFHRNACILDQVRPIFGYCKITVKCPRTECPVIKTVDYVILLVPHLLMTYY